VLLPHHVRWQTRKNAGEWWRCTWILRHNSLVSQNRSLRVRINAPSINQPADRSDPFMKESNQRLPEYRKSGHRGELYSEIEIRASPEKIWNVLTDFAVYSSWNPFIRTIEGTPVKGAKLSVYLKPSGATGMRFKPVVVKVHPQHELRWIGHLFFSGLFDGEHVFEIRQTAPGICVFVQHEYFSGIFLPFLETMLKKDTSRGFHEMNEALKTRAELAGSE
jgi:hypothetical protein